MRRSIFGGAGIIALIAIAIVAWLAIFTVDPTKYALVLRLGEPIRAITEPGLYGKLPVIDNVVYVEKRILDLDLPSIELNSGNLGPEEEEGPGVDNDPEGRQKRLVVDAFIRYKILDPLLFYQAAGSEANAATQISVMLNSAVRRVLTDASFTDIVRDRRAELMTRITTQVDANARGLGVQAVDVKIRRADLPEANSQAIYQRMQTERQQQATLIRADGEQRARRIRADADRDATITVANANRQSEQIRGEGDARRNTIFAEAFGRDEDFFAFYRSMQAYQDGLKPGSTRMLLSPSSEFFRYFNDLDGVRTAASEERTTPARPIPQVPQSLLLAPEAPPAAADEEDLPPLPPKPDEVAPDQLSPANAPAALPAPAEILSNGGATPR